MDNSSRNQTQLKATAPRRRNVYLLRDTSKLETEEPPESVCMFPESFYSKDNLFNPPTKKVHNDDTSVRLKALLGDASSITAVSIHQDDYQTPRDEGNATADGRGIFAPAAAGSLHSHTDRAISERALRPAHGSEPLGATVAEAPSSHSSLSRQPMLSSLPPPPRVQPSGGDVATTIRQLVRPVEVSEQSAAGSLELRSVQLNRTPREEGRSATADRRRIVAPAAAEQLRSHTNQAIGEGSLRPAHGSELLCATVAEAPSSHSSLSSQPMLSSLPPPPQQQPSAGATEASNASTKTAHVTAGGKAKSKIKWIIPSEPYKPGARKYAANKTSLEEEHQEQGARLPTSSNPTPRDWASKRKGC